MLGGGRQLDHEPRASELRVLEPDFPPDFGHHALADREAQARALVGALGGKNGSKMRPRISRGMPGPESSTVNRTHPSRACVRSCTIAGFRPRTTYSALVTRLITTCCSS